MPEATEKLPQISSADLPPKRLDQAYLSYLSSLLHNIIVRTGTPKEIVTQAEGLEARLTDLSRRVGTQPPSHELEDEFEQISREFDTLQSSIQ